MKDSAHSAIIVILGIILSLRVTMRKASHFEPWLRASSLQIYCGICVISDLKNEIFFGSIRRKFWRIYGGSHARRLTRPIANQQVQNK